MTTLTLPDDLEAWAREQVAAGRADSVEGLIEKAIREHRGMLEAHRALVEEGYAALARGEFIEEAEMDALFDRWEAEDLAAER